MTESGFTPITEGESLSPQESHPQAGEKIRAVLSTLRHNPFVIPEATLSVMAPLATAVVGLATGEWMPFIVTSSILPAIGTLARPAITNYANDRAQASANRGVSNARFIDERSWVTFIADAWRTRTTQRPGSSYYDADNFSSNGRRES